MSSGEKLRADFVIAGAGPAAVAAAETLRDCAPDSSIIMLAGEAEPPYSRMAIPYVLTGLIGESGTYLRKEEGHFRAQEIDVVHARVSAVNVAEKNLELDGKGTCSFGKLLIATGASPVNPPISGLDLPGVHHCWTLEDARAVAARAKPGSRVLLMGAGFIGCIILEALASHGAKLTVVEAEDRMVPRMMNETAGNMIKDWCTAKGMNILTSTRVEKLQEADGKIRVDMDNGASEDVDLVVVATGVASNIGFLQDAGLETGQGIKVDHYLESSVKGIFAAGDCAEGPDFSTGGWSVHAIQPTASEHGRIAALNMAGKKARYKGSLNMNVLDTAGLISASFGDWSGSNGGECAEVIDRENFRYTHLAFDEDRLVGALTLGRTANIGVIRGLIQSRTRLGEWKDHLMADPARLAEAYIASTQNL
ncbi:MAG TPA: NAD(P)/FAD-dependent oxidoreductase [Rhizobiales bacterium]|nr:NAD(P)/FAD-dependent oxidoreductase [Hyphomicrobiales bacterium]